DGQRVSVSYDGFVDDVQVGDPLFIDDGKVRLRVLEKGSDFCVCQVEQGGTLSNQKGVNLPKTQIRMSAMTDKDRKDCKMAIDFKLDYVALSFVSHEDDIKELRTHLDKLGGKHIQIIAKIERPQALDRISHIIDAADAIMVARGDLGVEIGVENVPKTQ